MTNDELTQHEQQLVNIALEKIKEEGHSGATFNIFMRMTDSFIKNDGYNKDEILDHPDSFVAKTFGHIYEDKELTTERKEELTLLIMRTSSGKPETPITEDSFLGTGYYDEKSGETTFQNSLVSSVFISKNDKGEIVSVRDVDADISVSLSRHFAGGRGYGRGSIEKKLPYVAPLIPKRHYYVDDDFTHPLTKEQSEIVYQTLLEKRYTNFTTSKLKGEVLITKAEFEEHLKELSSITFPYETRTKTPEYLTRYLGLMGFNATYLGNGEFRVNDEYQYKTKFILSQVYLPNEEPLIDANGEHLYIVSLDDVKVTAYKLTDDKYFLECPRYNNV